jgi:hypothetical protein
MPLNVTRLREGVSKGVKLNFFNYLSDNFVLRSIFGTINFHFHFLKMKITRPIVPGLWSNVTKCHVEEGGGLKLTIKCHV